MPGLPVVIVIGSAQAVDDASAMMAKAAEASITRWNIWGIFRGLCVASDVRGPRVSHAWFAALAIEWGCEWITFDRDYARFPDLKWHVPE